jgi:hypothetical protein
MIFSEAKAIVEATIVRKLRHVDYDKCCEIARKSKIYVTGEGQDVEFLIDLRDKETERQKQIRVKVTKPITPFALNPVRTEFLKMFRVDGVTVAVTGNELESLNDAIATYHSNASLADYLERRYVHWNFLDPNAWILTERRNQVDENGIIKKVDVYPLEVSSDQAINYGYDNGVPQWLLIRQERVEYVLNGKESEAKVVYDYYFYTAGISLRYSEYIAEIPFPGTPITLTIDGHDTPTNFMYAEYTTGTKEFPGAKWGAYDDPDSDGTVKVPPYWDGARFLLEDLIGTNSVFQVSKHNHVFPQLFRYVERCKFTSNKGEHCIGGYIEGSKSHPCPECKGTGDSLHFGESDAITFDIKDIEDLSKLPKLSDLAYYHQPPIEVTKELYQWVESLTEKIYIASFNTNNVDKGLVTKTATEIAKLWDDINARIYTGAQQMSRIYEKTIRIAAQFLEKEVEVNHSFPRDMKLEPLDVLLERYKAADGLPYEVRTSILFNILGKTFLDNPGVVENIKAWEYWKPFKSLNDEMIALILQDRDKNDFDKLLYQNWDSVQREVEQGLKDNPFSEIKRDAQYKLIKAALEKIQVGIAYVEQDVPMPDLTLIENQTLN